MERHDWPTCGICKTEVFGGHPILEVTFTLLNEGSVDMTEDDIERGDGDDAGVSCPCIARQGVTTFVACQSCVEGLKTIEERFGPLMGMEHGARVIQSARATGDVVRDLARWAAKGMQQCRFEVNDAFQIPHRGPISRWIHGKLLGYKKVRQEEMQAVLDARRGG